MMKRSKHRRARRCALGASALLCLACTSPDLGHTLFSCTTDGDCAPGQVCASFQGALACQSAPITSDSACSDGICGAAGSSKGNGETQPGTSLDATGSVDTCDEGGCVRSAASPSTGEGSPELAPTDARLADAGATAGGEGVDASAPAAATDAGQYTPSIRFDFESSLEAWQSVRNQLPEDTLDGTEQSTELAHHGTGALRMVFDGAYTPTPGVSADSRAFYGVYEPGGPPPGAAVSLWMLSTAPGVSIEVYTESGPTYEWTTLASVPLVQNQWREISVTLPPVQALQFGVQVHSPLDLNGFIYLDEISW